MLLLIAIAVVAFNGSAFIAQRALARWADRPVPRLSLALVVGWLWVIPYARSMRELVPAATRPRSGFRLTLGILTVATVSRVFQVLFTIHVKKTKQRASHAYGFAMSGHAKVTWNEAFAPGFLSHGRNLRVVLRHATIVQAHNAALDGRGVGIRLTSDHGESMSLLCNASPRTPFWDTRSTAAFFAAMGGNEAKVRKWIEGSARVAAAWKAGVSRAPTSLAELAYWSQQPVLLHGADGVDRAVRFRVRGAGVTDPEGANHLSAADAEAPWAQERRPGTSLPADYLRDEYRDRLASGPVRYVLDAQFLELDDIATRDTFAGDAHWDETVAPWIEVATIAVDRMLDPAEEDEIRLYPGEYPNGIELFRPAGPADPNVVLWYRSRVYWRAQEARRPYDRTPEKELDSSRH